MAPRQLTTTTSYSLPPPPPPPRLYIVTHAGAPLRTTNTNTAILFVSFHSAQYWHYGAMFPFFLQHCKQKRGRALLAVRLVTFSLQERDVHRLIKVCSSSVNLNETAEVGCSLNSYTTCYSTYQQPIKIPEICTTSPRHLGGGRGGYQYFKTGKY